MGIACSPASSQPPSYSSALAARLACGDGQQLLSNRSGSGKKKSRVLSASAPNVPTAGSFVPPSARACNGLMTPYSPSFFPVTHSVRPSTLSRRDLRSIDPHTHHPFSNTLDNAFLPCDRRSTESMDSLDSSDGTDSHEDGSKDGDSGWANAFRYICLQGLDQQKLFGGREADKDALHTALSCFDRIMRKLTRVPATRPPLLSVEQTARLDTANSTSLMGAFSGWFAHQVDQTYLTMSVSIDNGHTFDSDLFTFVCERHEESVTSSLSLLCNGKRGRLLRVPSGTHLWPP